MQPSFRFPRCGAGAKQANCRKNHTTAPANQSAPLRQTKATHLIIPFGSRAPGGGKTVLALGDAQCQAASTYRSYLPLLFLPLSGKGQRPVLYLAWGRKPQVRVPTCLCGLKARAITADSSPRIGPLKQRFIRESSSSSARLTIGHGLSYTPPRPPRHRRTRPRHPRHHQRHLRQPPQHRLKAPQHRLTPMW
jgi:hypothetical protein